MPVAAALHLNETHEPPFLITAFAEGAARFRADSLEAFCSALAASLHAIHSVSLREYDLSFLPCLRDAITSNQTPATPEMERIGAALRRARPRVDFNAPALLHGDFWPGNLLWRGEELSAIIDWEDAMLGDPLADLGKSRLEVLWALGPAAMTAYTARYLALRQSFDATGLPFWDLWGASRLSHFASFAPSPEAVPRMKAQYETFIEDAMQRLETL